MFKARPVGGVRSQTRREDVISEVGNGWAVSITTLMNERQSIGAGGGLGALNDLITFAESVEIESVVGVAVVLWDERFTTVTAEQSLMRQDVDGKRRRKIIDKVAATVMLQGWLDAKEFEDDRVASDE